MNSCSRNPGTMKPEVSIYVFVSCAIKVSSSAEPISTLGSLTRRRGELRVEIGVRACPNRVRQTITQRDRSRSLSGVSADRCSRGPI